MIVRTKYGSEIETEDFKGYGQFKKYVQDHYDKDWGKNKEKETKTYTITFVGTANVYATKEIEAYSEEDARGQAEKMARDTPPSEFDWEYSFNSDTDDVEVDEIECDEAQDE